MKGNVIKNLVVTKDMKRMIGKKVILCGTLNLLLPLEIVLAPNIYVQAKENFVEVDETYEEFSSMKPNTMMNLNQPIFRYGQLEYNLYLSFVANMYQIDLEQLKEQVEQNLESLLAQESLEEGIQTMIEQMITNGEVEREVVTKEKKVRLTTYQYTPNDSEKRLGGTIGLVEPYLEEGSMYFDENGFAIWKGGTSSKLNGKVYGEKGTDYLVVAAATKALIGQYTYTYNDQIHYYSYNDTFPLKVTTKHGEKEYQAIVLDSCGACMDWSTTSDGVYAPKTENEKGYCELTNGVKIDIFTAPIDDPTLTKPNDTGYQLEKEVLPMPEIAKMPTAAKEYMENQLKTMVMFNKIMQK